MRVLLPPSETKRAGGSSDVLDLSALALPGLRSAREEVIGALVTLSGDPEQAQRVLKLSERQRGEIELNALLREGPVMPAIDRYTGVLFDALGADGLDRVARRWLGAHVWIHSAPFGPVAALDPIPGYRLAAGTSLPGVPPLRRIWADAVTAAIAAAAPSFVLDLRSDAYVALGPVPASVPSAFVRVVTPDGRALNHFNKKAKGELVRLLALQRPRVSSLRGLLAWAERSGVELAHSTDPGVLELVVS